MKRNLKTKRQSSLVRQLTLPHSFPPSRACGEVMARPSNASTDNISSSLTSAEDTALWASLGLSASALTSNTTLPKIDADTLAKQLKEDQTKDPTEAWNRAVEESLAAYRNEEKHLQTLLDFEAIHIPKLVEAENTLLALVDRLELAERAAVDLQSKANDFEATVAANVSTQGRLSAFVDQLVLDPYLIRHVVDGKVGDVEYEHCLSALSKKVALYDMNDTKETASYEELNLYLTKLVRTAIAKVRNYLIDRISLLKRPNTNVKIVKENVLLKHRPLVDFIELHAPNVFREVKTTYVDTMSRTYFILFKKYLAGLLTLKQQLPSENADTLVGSLSDASEGRTSQSLSNLFYSSSKSSQGISRISSGGIARGAGIGQFALGSRLDVLKDMEGPAIVLATAIDNNERFYYEQIHRSLAKMLSETCASEHLFCKHFFGESDGRMFNTFFRKIVGFLLDAVAAHTAPTRDTIGVLLALKVNEAHRLSMQKRKILDLSDYFIQVDILLKPKFKKLLDENVASIAEAGKAMSRSTPRGGGDTSPHIVTRRYAEFSASLLAIARFGTPDDSILEGLRRLRSEFNSFLNAVSAMFSRAKLRYMFLINNIDLLLTMFRRHSVTTSEDYRFFAEFQEVHTAAYVEHEVADHFPDVVSFVRQYERTAKAQPAAGVSRRPFPSSDRAKAVLRQFASNWRLSVQHMQDNAIREFPNFDVGAELIRALFARLFAYHKRCETAIQTEYPQLKAEIVTSTEMIYELRQRSQQFMT